MIYEGAVYRPPSEAGSLIVQLTIGCARNTCTFCTMYKDKSFRIRPLEDVIADLLWARENYRFPIRRIFFADGDAFIVKTKDLLYVLKKTKELFPEIERISMYATPKDVIMKTDDELKALREAGLEMIYVGIESGDDTVLSDVKKGVSSSEIITACTRARKAGIVVSVTLISGLGGRERLREHAINSARVISAIKPEYVGFLTLMLEPETPMYEDLRAGRLTLLTPPDILDEMELFIKSIDSEGTVFRANHASNYIILGGTLNKDKEALLNEIEKARENRDFTPEGWRRF